MEAGMVKKNKKVREAAALAAAAIKDGKLQLPKPGVKRKFGADKSSSPFGTVTRPKGPPARPSTDPSPSIPEERLRGPGRGKGPLTPPKPLLLLDNASYAVEQVLSIVKEEDIKDCDKFATASIVESGLHDLARAIVRMKTLQLRCADYEDQVVKFKKRAKEYGDALKELQKSVAPLQEKNTALEAKVKSLEETNATQLNLILQAEGSNQQLSNEVEKLKGELAEAEVEAVAKHTSYQEYLQELAIQYVQGFEHFRTQASAAFPDLDFSKFEITAEEGSVATMASDGADQGVDSAAVEMKQEKEMNPET